MGERGGNMGYEMGSQKEIQAARDRVAIEQLASRNKPVEKKPDPYVTKVAEQMRQQKEAFAAQRAAEQASAAAAPAPAELPRVVPPARDSGKVWARTEKEVVEMPDMPAVDYAADAVAVIDRELKKPGATPEALRQKLDLKWKGLAEITNLLASDKRGMIPELQARFDDVLEQQTIVSAQMDELDRRFPPGKQAEKPRGAAIGLAEGQIAKGGISATSEKKNFGSVEAFAAKEIRPEGEDGARAEIVDGLKKGRPLDVQRGITQRAIESLGSELEDAEATEQSEEMIALVADLADAETSLASATTDDERKAASQKITSIKGDIASTYGQYTAEEVRKKMAFQKTKLRLIDQMKAGSD